MKHSVLIPRPGRLLSLEPGSGVVGYWREDIFVIDYEGNLNGASNLELWADRVHSALGRALTRYPTSARRAANPDDLLEVGLFDDETGIITLTAHLEQLKDWLGLSDLSPQLLTSSHRHEATRQLNSLKQGTPAERHQARELERRLRF